MTFLAMVARLNFMINTTMKNNACQGCEKVLILYTVINKNNCKNSQIHFCLTHHHFFSICAKFSEKLAFLTL